MLLNRPAIDKTTVFRFLVERPGPRPKLEADSETGNRNAALGPSKRAAVSSKPRSPSCNLESKDFFAAEPAQDRCYATMPRCSVLVGARTQTWSRNEGPEQDKELDQAALFSIFHRLARSLHGLPLHLFVSHQHLGGRAAGRSGSLCITWLKLSILRHVSLASGFHVFWDAAGCSVW